MEYRKLLIEHFEEMFASMSPKQLVKTEDWLSKFIDSDLFEDSLLADEVTYLYESVRDECVKRVSLIAD